MKKQITATIFVILCLFFPLVASAAGQETFLVHLKTSLKLDDAQICVAYNMMLAAQEEGYLVKVLVDGSAINTFKIGWRGKDNIEGYKIPEILRQALSSQFSWTMNKVPKTYGKLLLKIKKRGAEFYVNSGYLMVSKIGTPDEPLKKVSQKFFKPVTLQEMVKLRTGADYYMAY